VGRNRQGLQARGTWWENDHHRRQPPAHQAHGRRVPRACSWPPRSRRNRRRLAPSTRGQGGSKSPVSCFHKDGICPVKAWVRKKRMKKGEGLGPENAKKVVEHLKPKIAVPMAQLQQHAPDGNFSDGPYRARFLSTNRFSIRKIRSPRLPKSSSSRSSGPEICN